MIEAQLQQKFSELTSNLKTQGTEQLEKFLENPLPALCESDILLLQAIVLPVEAQSSLEVVQLKEANTAIGVSVPGNDVTEPISVKWRWWGVDIIMDQETTEKISKGLFEKNSLGSMLTTALAAMGVGSVIATVLGTVFALCFIEKSWQMKVTNKGKGVHWPISWIQWSMIICAVPAGPIAIALNAALYFHPVANS